MSLQPLEGFEKPLAVLVEGKKWNGTESFENPSPEAARLIQVLTPLHRIPEGLQEFRVDLLEAPASEHCQRESLWG
jgi:hypothetical protein